MPTDRDLNDIDVFLKVVEERSFTKAGKRLGMPRSTVSRRVAELEKRLGARLLHRTTRKLRLSEIGTRYYERCASGLATIEEAERCVLAANEEPVGRLRMTAPFGLGERLAPALAGFLQMHPKVQLEVELTQRMVDLIADNFDLAVRATAQLPDSSLIARPLASGPAALFASPRYVKEHGMPETPADLADHETVSFGAMQRAWMLTRADGTEVEAPIQPRLVANSPTLSSALVEAGLGIGLLPFDVNVAHDKSLVRVLPEYEGYRATLFLVYPSAKLLSASMRALRDHLLGHFAETSP